MTHAFVKPDFRSSRATILWKYTNAQLGTGNHQINPSFNCLNMEGRSLRRDQRCSIFKILPNG